MSVKQKANETFDAPNMIVDLEFVDALQKLFWCFHFL